MLNGFVMCTASPYVPEITLHACPVEGCIYLSYRT